MNHGIDIKSQKHHIKHSYPYGIYLYHTTILQFFVKRNTLTINISSNLSNRKQWATSRISSISSSDFKLGSEIY